MFMRIARTVEARPATSKQLTLCDLLGYDDVMGN
jgi:hypothetical protein